MLIMFPGFMLLVLIQISQSIKYTCPANSTYGSCNIDCKNTQCQNLTINATNPSLKYFQLICGINTDCNNMVIYLGSSINLTSEIQIFSGNNVTVYSDDLSNSNVNIAILDISKFTKWENVIQNEAILIISMILSYINLLCLVIVLMCIGSELGKNLYD